MAIYQTKRYLIDAVNGLELPVGTYIQTECVLWVNRFGSDLITLDADHIGSGYIIKTLTGLVEENLSTPQPDDQNPPMEDLMTDSAISKRIIRKKATL